MKSIDFKKQMVWFSNILDKQQIAIHTDYFAEYYIQKHIRNITNSHAQDYIVRWMLTSIVLLTILHWEESSISLSNSRRNK